MAQHSMAQHGTAQHTSLGICPSSSSRGAEYAPRNAQNSEHRRASVCRLPGWQACRRRLQGRRGLGCRAAPPPQLVLDCSTGAGSLRGRGAGRVGSWQTSLANGWLKRVHASLPMRPALHSRCACRSSAGWRLHGANPPLRLFPPSCRVCRLCILSFQRAGMEPVRRLLPYTAMGRAIAVELCAGQRAGPSALVRARRLSQGVQEALLSHALGSSHLI